MPGSRVPPAGILAGVILASSAAACACYALLPLAPARGRRTGARWDRPLGTATYAVAYLLGLLRTPLGLVPYLVKLFIVFALGVRYDATRTTYRREALNMAGDIANLGVTALLMRHLAGPPARRPSTALLYVPLGAEFVRLLCERVPLTVSVAWQLIPHRAIARALQRRRGSLRARTWPARSLARYRRYYARDDDARARYLLHALKRRAAPDRDLSARLAYITAFRIVPTHHGLRGGLVRDVAAGEVFIHRSWTNDPWVLAGLAIRRAPWMFDPRYLRRPFYYHSEANRAATLCVLRHARHCPPYALFTFGHEIRVARLDLFFRTLRRLGWAVEGTVEADGTFTPDQFIRWLDRRYGRGFSGPAPPPLASDDEAIADALLLRAAGARVDAPEIAARHTYPVCYVTDVLLPRIDAAWARAAVEVQGHRRRRA